MWLLLVLSLFRVPSPTRQLVLVLTERWDASAGQLSRWRREPGGAWQAVGRPLPVVVGQAGLGWGRGLHPSGLSGPVKREGDRRAPAGVFRLLEATGYAAEPPRGTSLTYRQASARLRCVDDPRSALYNQLTEDATTGELMRRGDDLYVRTIVIEHNRGPAEPGAGSCIFVHAWAGPRAPTIGCTALPAPELESLVSWLDATAQPLIVQLPRAAYQKLAASWGLPAARGSGE
ncbi:MAG TPA: L,D-transpeptidase family protein [Polyangia bacterium]|nr:L,D-transpeptidase family protein [Polyangia bacterium]